MFIALSTQKKNKRTRQDNESSKVVFVITARDADADFTSPTHERFNVRENTDHRYHDVCNKFLKIMNMGFLHQVLKYTQKMKSNK